MYLSICRDIKRMQVFCAGVLLQSCVEKILDLRRRESSGYGGRPDGSPRGRVRCRAQQGARTSRAEMTPRRMTMRHGGGTEHERGVFRAKCARERVSARPIGRHPEVAEERSRGAGFETFAFSMILWKFVLNFRWLKCSFHQKFLCGLRPPPSRSADGATVD